MRFLLGAAVAAIAMTGAAWAQTEAPASETPPPPSRCPAFAAPPTLPDGATTRNNAAMNRGTEAFNAWAASLQTVSECRRTEVRELEAQYLALHGQARARTAEFNAAVAQQLETCRAWQGEVAEFNTRQGRTTETEGPDPCGGAPRQGGNGN